MIVPDIEGQIGFNEVIVPDIHPTSGLVRCCDTAILLNTEMTKEREKFITINQESQQIHRLEFGRDTKCNKVIQLTAEGRQHIKS